MGKTKIDYTDLRVELTDELDAINGILVGQIAALLTNSTKEEKVAALAVAVNYFKVCGNIDMEKFHALLEMCDASEASGAYSTGYNGPPVKA